MEPLLPLKHVGKLSGGAPNFEVAKKLNQFIHDACYIPVISEIKSSAEEVSGKTEGKKMIEQLLRGQ